MFEWNRLREDAHADLRRGELTEHSRAVHIAIEGGEAVGKATLVKNLTESLHVDGIKVTYFTSPRDQRNPAGRWSNELLFGSKRVKSANPYVREMYFVADLMGLATDCIWPALDEGCNVITERFDLSCWIYSTVWDSLSGARIKELMSAIELRKNVSRKSKLNPSSTSFTGNVSSSQWEVQTIPHLTFVLDVPEEVAMERAKKRSVLQPSLHDFMDEEPLEVYMKIRKAYLHEASIRPKTHIVIDVGADRTPETVCQIARTHLNKAFPDIFGDDRIRPWE